MRPARVAMRGAAVRTHTPPLLGLALCVACVAAAAASDPVSLRVDVNATSGEYEVWLGAARWLVSAPVRVTCNGTVYSSASDTAQGASGSGAAGVRTVGIHVVHVGSTSGTDPWGAFTSTELTWAAGQGSAFALATRFRTYTAVSSPQLPQLVVLEHAFGCACNTSVAGIAPVLRGAYGPYDTPASEFPSFVVGSGSAMRRGGTSERTRRRVAAGAAVAGTLSWRYYTAGSPLGHQLSTLSGTDLANVCTPDVDPALCGTNGGVPLIIFNATAPRADGPAACSTPLAAAPSPAPTLVITTLSRFKDTVVGNRSWSGTPALAWGVQGALTTLVPPGTTFQVALAGGLGVRSTTLAAGAALRQWYRREPVDTSANVGLSHVSYWTDNGAYYYYNTLAGNHGAAAANYTSTFAAVRAEAARKGISFGSYQVDSFWYPKANQTGAGICPWAPPLTGLTEWSACPAMFPHGGMPYTQQKVLGGAGVVAHSRWLAPTTTYASMPEFDMEVNPRAAWPRNARAFFDYIIGAGVRQWGLTMYEQDWTGVWYLWNPQMWQELGVADEWFQAMGASATANGILVGYGTIQGSVDVVQGVSIPSAAFVFGSQNPNRAAERSTNWRISRVNALTTAVGMVTMKDCFWTSTTQPGNPYNPPMIWPNPELHAVVALLSGGPVGVADGVGHLNATIINATCAPSGLLLRPDTPCVALDAMLVAPVSDGELCVAPSATASGYAAARSPQLAPCSTSSDSDSGAVWYTVFAGALVNAQAVWPSQLPADGTQPAATYWAVQWQAAVPPRRQAATAPAVQVVTEASPLKIPAQPPHGGSGPDTVFEWALYGLAPVLEGGWVVAGEPGKYVAFSRQRFTYVRVDAGGNDAAAGTELHVGVALHGSRAQEVWVGNAGANTSASPAGGAPALTSVACACDESRTRAVTGYTAAAEVTCTLASEESTRHVAGIEASAHGVHVAQAIRCSCTCGGQRA